MSLQNYHPAKLFSPREANAALPLVRSITQDISRLCQTVLERQQRLSHLVAGRDFEAGDPYGEELAQVEEELRGNRGRLREYQDELMALGVELKDGVSGLLDFPSLREGRIVYLCWRLGESHVEYWHELETGFAGRQLLEPPEKDTSEDPQPLISSSK